MVENPLQHSLGAVNVGSSVMGLKYKDGVMIAADTAISYGGMRKVKDARRIEKLNDEVVFGCSGEMADMQMLKKELEKLNESDDIEQDGATYMTAREYYNFLSRHNYQRRCKMDPLWCSTVIGGVSKETKEAFLGVTDLYGTKIEHDFVLTGLSIHYCQVLMQNGWRADLTEDEARKLIADCMEVMFCRDKKATDRVQITTITEAGVTMHEPIQVDSKWDLQWYLTDTNEKFRPMRIRM